MKPLPTIRPRARKTETLTEPEYDCGVPVAPRKSAPVIREPLNRGLAVTDKRQGAWQNRATRMQMSWFEVSLS
jgi:hypothetical protein